MSPRARGNLVSASEFSPRAHPVWGRPHASAAWAPRLFLSHLLSPERRAPSRCPLMASRQEAWVSFPFGNLRDGSKATYLSFARCVSAGLAGAAGLSSGVSQVPRPERGRSSLRTRNPHPGSSTVTAPCPPASVSSCGRARPAEPPLTPTRLRAEGAPSPSPPTSVCVGVLRVRGPGALWSLHS